MEISIRNLEQLKKVLHFCKLKVMEGILLSHKNNLFNLADMALCKLPLIYFIAIGKILKKRKCF